jgi:D-alanyl-D-alanine carboxypeptidase
MKRRKYNKIKKLKTWLMIEAGVLAVVVLIAIIVTVDLANKKDQHGPQLQQVVATEPSTQAPETEPTWMEFPADREITAAQAFIFDCGELRLDTVKGAENDKLYPASVTKLLTAYVALQYLAPTDQIVAGDVLDLVGAGSSVAQIKKGDVLTVEQLVAALLLPSGNDAAYILAEACGRAAEADDTISGWSAISIFMREMNAYARSFGMKNTNFTNPDGYHDPNHYTTVSDLVKLTQKVMEDETIMKYTKVSTMDMTLGGETVTWHNTNAIIDPSSPYYCPYAVGMKTGKTPSAGSCLLTVFTYAEHTWIIGVFGCPTEESRFEDTLQIFNQTYHSVRGES